MFDYKTAAGDGGRSTDLDAFHHRVPAALILTAYQHRCWSENTSVPECDTGSTLGPGMRIRPLKQSDGVNTHLLQARRFNLKLPMKARLQRSDCGDASISHFALHFFYHRT